MLLAKIGFFQRLGLGDWKGFLSQWKSLAAAASLPQKSQLGRFKHVMRVSPERSALNLISPGLEQRSTSDLQSTTRRQ